MATPQHNLQAILNGTAEFSFAEGATTVATAQAIGYRDIGNVNKASVTPTIADRKVKGSYRGVLRTDKVVTTETELSFKLTTHEINRENLRLLLRGAATTGHTQTSQTAQNGDALAFSVGSPSDSTKWYDLKISGARIRNVTTLTIATLTEGTDFEVDTLLGRVRFLTSQTTSRTPVITAPAITANSAGAFDGMTPLDPDNLVISGYGRLVVYDEDDDNQVVSDWVDFSCDLKADGNWDIDKASGESTLEITVTITDDVGTFLTRDSLG